MLSLANNRDKWVATSDLDDGGRALRELLAAAVELHHDGVPFRSHHLKATIVRYYVRQEQGQLASRYGLVAAFKPAERLGKGS